MSSRVKALNQGWRTTFRFIGRMRMCKSMSGGVHMCPSVYALTQALNQGWEEWTTTFSFIGKMQANSCPGVYKCVRACICASTAHTCHTKDGAFRGSAYRAKTTLTKLFWLATLISADSNVSRVQLPLGTGLCLSALHITPPFSEIPRTLLSLWSSRNSCNGT